MSNIHGIEVHFGDGTEHIKKLLENMDSHDAKKFFEHAESHGKSSLMDSRIEHAKGEDGEGKFSVHLHH
jgi:hypothetical protein